MKGPVGLGSVGWMRQGFGVMGHLGMVCDLEL